MKKRLFHLVILFVFIQFIISAYIFAEPPVIKESEVKRIYLFLVKTEAEIEGYVVFYDKDNQQCAVEVTSEYGPFPAILYSGNKYAHIFERKLYITPHDFKFFATKWGDLIYGYIIEPFLTGISRERLNIFFEWGSLSTNTTVYMK